MLYTVAITAEATADTLSAGRHSTDLLGMVLIACVTTLDGGSVRDMLLGHYPLTWVRHSEYLALTIVAALVTVFIVPLVRHLRSLLLVLDVVSLAASTLIGCQVSLEMGRSLLIAAISGVIIGVLSGIPRDILCNDVPLIFRRELCVSVSSASAWCHPIRVELELSSEQVMLITLLSDFLFRPPAIRFYWEISKFVYQGDFDHWGKRLPLVDAFLQPRVCLRCHGPQRGYPPHALACHRPLPVSVL